MSTSAIHIQGLHKRFGSPWGAASHALRGVDLTVEKGAAFGLIGPNGAGKTTLIKTLLAVMRPTLGNVSVLGGSPEDVRVRARIGYLPERLHLPSQGTPLTFLDGVARLKAVPIRARETSALLQRVGMAEHAQARIGGFSKGMKQRLGLAAALVGRPELLVLDEPTDGVDPVGRLAIRELLLEERRRGTTVLLNSHLLGETERVCTEVGILVAGQLVHRGALGVSDATPKFRVRFAAPPPEEWVNRLGLERGALPNEVLVTAASPESLNAQLDLFRREGRLLVGLEQVTQDLEAMLLGALAGNTSAK